MYSTITDVKEVSLYVRARMFPKMQFVKFIRLEIFKMNGKSSKRGIKEKKPKNHNILRTQKENERF